MTFLMQRAAVIGLGTGLAIGFGLHRIFDAAIVGFAIGLAVVGAIYLGALLTEPAPSRRAIWQESTVSALTFGLVALGVLINPHWLVLGYFGHAAWDWAHHGHRCGARIVTWYPPFCAVVDIVLGLILLGMIHL
ncbi:hypothetical protein [Aestuariibius sp. HNIBRBA575]|uniref:hypothetical protein n=1 Tax=Aestuariibius sp. HNIBRBA575 TaxID=3233343 RepID=UPI0034A3DAE4